MAISIEIGTAHAAAELTPRGCGRQKIRGRNILPLGEAYLTCEKEKQQGRIKNDPAPVHRTQAYDLPDASMACTTTVPDMPNSNI